MNEPRVTLDTDGFARASGWISAHLTSHQTNEYLETCDVYVSVATGLPAGAHLDELPSIEEGFAIVWADTGWVSVEDHRGEIVYDKQTQRQVVIESLGRIPDHLTRDSPTSVFDVWDSAANVWVKDCTAQAESQKAQLTASAEQSIRPLERAKQLGIATAEELAALTEWERYSVFLMRVDTGKAPNIDWPAVPTV